jgi:hypothetical protein
LAIAWRTSAGLGPITRRHSHFARDAEDYERDLMDP